MTLRTTICTAALITLTALAASAPSFAADRGDLTPPGAFFVEAGYNYPDALTENTLAATGKVVNPADSFTVQVPAWCTVHAAVWVPSVPSLGPTLLNIEGPSGAVVQGQAINSSCVVADFTAGNDPVETRVLVGGPSAPLSCQGHEYTLQVQIRCPLEPPATCEEDSNEGKLGNDALATATMAAVPAMFAGAVCAGDIDYFAVAVPVDCQTAVDLYFTPRNPVVGSITKNQNLGDLTLGVFDNFGAPLFESATDNASEHIVIPAGQGGIVFVAVYGADDHQTGSYLLTLSQTCSKSEGVVLNSKSAFVKGGFLPKKVQVPETGTDER